MIELINSKNKSSVLNQLSRTIWRRNNMEFNGIPKSITDGNLESTVINVLSKATNVHVATGDIEACHRISKSKGNSKKTIV